MHVIYLLGGDISSTSGRTGAVCVGSLISPKWTLAIESRLFALIHIDGLISRVKKKEMRANFFKDVRGEPEKCHSGPPVRPENPSPALSSSGTHPKCELLNRSTYIFMRAEAGGGGV